MKLHSILFASLICGLVLARAQEMAAPGPTPAPSPEPGTLPLLQPPDLMPAPNPAPPAVSPAATPQAIFEKGTAEQLRQAIRIRELKTVVAEDPEVLAQKAMAEAAKTEAGRCVAMRNYYTLLYTKMEKLDPSLQAILEPQLRGILSRYEQHHVFPSELTEPIVALPGSHFSDHDGAAVPNANPSGKSSKKQEKKH